jgi:hypothetical protein
VDYINPTGHDTLDSLIAGYYPSPDKQDFANFLRLILIVRPERRANMPVLLHQRWLQKSLGTLPDENPNRYVDTPATWTQN